MDVLWPKLNPCVSAIPHHLTACTHVPTSTIQSALQNTLHFHAFPARLSIVFIPWSSSLFLCLHAVYLIWPCEGVSLTASPIRWKHFLFIQLSLNVKSSKQTLLSLFQYICFIYNVFYPKCLIFVFFKVLPAGGRCTHEDVHMNASFSNRDCIMWRYGRVLFYSLFS